MKKLLIWGTGKTADKLWECLDRENSSVIGFVDNDMERIGKLYNGIHVIDPANILNYKFDYLIIASIFYDEIVVQCIEIGIAKEDIIDGRLGIENWDVYSTFMKKEKYDEIFCQDIKKLKLQIDRIERVQKEILWANVFQSAIKGSSWLKEDLALFPGRGAAGYQWMYIIYRILEILKPNRILDLGLGESSKIFSEYVKYYGGRHIIVEHDRQWGETFSNYYSLSEKSKIVYAEAITALPEELPYIKSNVMHYVKFKKLLKDEKFDLISIDGPYGYDAVNGVSRVDILKILPQCIEKTFAIVLDDTNRIGEKCTLNRIVSCLEKNNIECWQKTYSGEKDVSIIVSRNLKFLCLL